MDSRVFRKILLVLALSGLMIGRQSLSVWAHTGHHVDANATENTAPQAPPKPAPKDISDGAHLYEQVLASALYIPGFMGSSSGPKTESLGIAGHVLSANSNVIGEGALLMVVSSPFLLYAARRSWA